MARKKTAAPAVVTPEKLPEEDPVTQYAIDVLENRIVASRLVKLACQRHLRDMDEQEEKGILFDAQKANHVIGFFHRFFRLAEGEFAGKPFILQPWQRFIVGSLFGWLNRGDRFRRFRTAYIEVGKGSGKSPMAAAIGLYALIADDEGAPQIYAAATTREQASITFRDAVNMANASVGISKRVKVLTRSIEHPSSEGYFRPVSSEHRGLDGKRPHVVIIDELHEHPSSMVVDKMRAGTKGRRQALIVEITNAGHNRDSVCWQHHDYSVKMLQGIEKENDAWFSFVCGLDPCDECWEEGKTQPVEGCSKCDDWHDEKCWPKANPNLTVSISPRYLREQVEEAEGMPSKESIVKRLNFCIWVQSEVAWLPRGLWEKGGGLISVPDLAGAECFGGLDIASKLDVAALVLCFKDRPNPGCYTLLARFWLPMETALHRDGEGDTKYLLWEKAGLITLTEGETIDQDLIEEDIKAIHGIHNILKIAYDPWNAGQLANHLHLWGVEMISFQQTMHKFNEPTKTFEALMREGKIRHGDNEILTWMAGNANVLTDRSGSIRPVKPDHNSPLKIDGIVSAVMSLGVALMEPENPTPSVWIW